MQDQHLTKLLAKQMSRKEFLSFAAVSIGSVFGVVGLIEALKSHATTPTVSIQPENSAVSTATIVQDTSASGSKAIKFNPASSTPPPTSSVRPSGKGYVRYEDLYKSGDTVSTAMARLNASSPNANADGTAIITFPEGVFACSDFKAAGSTTYGIYVPKNCLGIWGSGRGTLGDTSHGTIFTMVPNSSTRTPIVQDNKSPNPVTIMYHGSGSAGARSYGQFQVAGTEQGHTFNGFTINNPGGPVTAQDILTTGWSGDNGSPPGETFGFNMHGGNGPHKLYRIEADGRRAVGEQAYGAVGITLENCYRAEMHECYSHHQRASTVVFYQAFNCKTFNCVVGPSLNGLSANPTFNHERTAGSVHTNLIQHLTATNKGVNITHSNDTFTTTIDGHACTTVDGSLTLINPTYDAIYSNGRLYIQSFTPYANGDTIKTAPVVLNTDGSHMPYTWVHGASQIIT